MRSLLTFAAFSAMIFGSGGCMDMFDPSGGSYAKNRYVDTHAFTMSEAKSTDAGTTFTFVGQKPAATIKLRSVYLFSYLPPERRNGPHLKFDWDGTSKLIVTVRKEDAATFSGITIFGDYDSPTLAIEGARSVNIAQEFFFPK